MLTEVSQVLITLIVLLGGGYMLIAGHIDPDTAGMVKGLMLSWSGFWLGAKVQRNIPTSTTTKVGPAETTTSTGQQG